MERRRLLRHLLSLSARNLTETNDDNYLTSCDQHEVKTVCDALSSLYDRKLTVRLGKAAAFLTRYAFSPLTSEAYGLLGTPPRSNRIDKYEIVKIGRREFLIIGGVVIAAAVGGALYYVSPGFRTLTTIVTKTPTETKPILIETSETTTSKSSETSIGTYRMTVSTIWYYRTAQKGQGYEMHFKTARRGKVEDVRRALASEGATYFQETIYSRFRRWIPKRKLRIGFEREEPAAKAQNNTIVHARYMEYRGGEWKSSPMPSRVLRYAKKA
jgi:hypothetical protein